MISIYGFYDWKSASVTQTEGEFDDSFALDEPESF